MKSFLVTFNSRAGIARAIGLVAGVYASIVGDVKYLDHDNTSLTVCACDLAVPDDYRRLPGVRDVIEMA